MDVCRSWFSSSVKYTGNVVHSRRSWQTTVKAWRHDSDISPLPFDWKLPIHSNSTGLWSLPPSLEDQWRAWILSLLGLKNSASLSLIRPKSRLPFRFNGDRLLPLGEALGSSWFALSCFFFFSGSTTSNKCLRDTGSECKWDREREKKCIASMHAASCRPRAEYSKRDKANFQGGLKTSSNDLK